IYGCPPSRMHEPVVMLQLRTRVLQRVALDLQIAQGENEVPIGALHAGDCFDRSLAKLRVRQRKILFGDLYLPAWIIKAQPAHQRLREIECQRRRVQRIKGRKRVISRGPNRRKVETISAATFWREAFKTQR